MSLFSLSLSPLPSLTRLPLPSVLPSISIPSIPSLPVNFSSITLTISIPPLPTFLLSSLTLGPSDAGAGGASFGGAAAVTSIGGAVGIGVGAVGGLCLVCTALVLIAAFLPRGKARGSTIGRATRILAQSALTAALDDGSTPLVVDVPPDKAVVADDPILS